MIETIKYGSKIFTEPDPGNYSKSTLKRNIYLAAMDNIYAAMQGKRLFE